MPFPRCSLVNNILTKVANFYKLRRPWSSNHYPV